MPTPIHPTGRKGVLIPQMDGVKIEEHMEFCMRSYAALQIEIKELNCWSGSCRRNA